jgi:hypothetical protein
MGEFIPCSTAISVLFVLGGVMSVGVGWREV